MRTLMTTEEAILSRSCHYLQGALTITRLKLPPQIYCYYLSKHTFRVSAYFDSYFVYFSVLMFFLFLFTAR